MAAQPGATFRADHHVVATKGDSHNFAPLASRLFLCASRPRLDPSSRDLKSAIPSTSTSSEVRALASMGNSFSAAKTLIIPALISLILYLILTYIIVPLYTRYRTRYSYIPVPLAPSLDSISSRTASIRARLQSAAGRFMVPSAWRRRTDVVSAEGDEEGLDFEEGEELGQVRGVEDGRDGRGARQGVDDVRRLSRDLEEGFMDDSEEEEEEEEEESARRR